MAVTDSNFLRACRGQAVDHTPVWFMRQAGRALPEYRALRADNKMLEACASPDLITEITLQPVRRFGVDAAIFFSDIVVPLVAVGLDIDIKAGIGPVIEKPIATWSDLERIPELTADRVDYITAAVQQLVGELGDTPLIGFAGAPFTLASYLVEGGPSKNHTRTKALMRGDTELWNALLARLAQISATFLEVQLAAGASAVQLFDSWAGVLSPKDYAAHVMPHSRSVFERIAPLGAPRIHFGVGTGEILSLMSDAGPDVVGVDWRVPLSEAAKRVPGKPLQGNLDPALMFAPWDVLAAEVADIVEQGKALPGHVFNLGHGVLPEMDPDVIKRVVDEVHTISAR